ncbi:hypothetical protein GCM10012275_53810 [Longimycelium tulufanense]|uniref:Uncharacterized protein n=1 Tax=Longimycelium tulufanense TaxID=907463 RepID=A0A8J3FYJ4_9PSEU|nr:hypothetical protein GCM10012275_53810 [Longimycelium tulufanense]
MVRLRTEDTDRTDGVVDERSVLSDQRTINGIRPIDGIVAHPFSRTKSPAVASKFQLGHPNSRPDRPSPAHAR